MEPIELDAERFEMTANMLKAIAHPMRIAILSFLGDGRRSSVTEIHEKLGIDQATTSHHLGILKGRGALCSLREGKYSFYYVKNKAIIDVIRSIDSCSCED